MRSALAPTLALLALALACAPAPTRPDLPRSTAASSDPVDVEAQNETAGTLRVVIDGRAGTLVADSLDTDDDGAEGDALEARGCDPWDCESRAHATWTGGTTVLSAGSDTTSDDGTPGGWIGAVLPWGDASAVAVRSWSVDWADHGLGERDDELVSISLADVSMRAIYAPGGRLRLMGVIGGHAIALVSSRDGTHHVVAVDGTGVERARSDAVAPSQDVLAGTGTELGLPHAVPLDAAAIAFACTDTGGLCVARFDGAALTLERTSLVEGDGLVLTERGACATRGDDCRPIASDSDFAPCEDAIAAYASDGLPVDGSLVIGAEGEVSLAVVRTEIVLDPPDPEAEQLPPRALAGVVLLAAPEGGATGIGLELLVRGDHLAVSYTRVGNADAATQRRDLGLALPPGSVAAERVSIGGAPGHHVRIETTFPIHYSHDCWQGFWVVRAWYEDGGEAFTQAYAEYGYCD